MPFRFLFSICVNESVYNSLTIVSVAYVSFTNLIVDGAVRTKGTDLAWLDLALPCGLLEAAMTTLVSPMNWSTMRFGLEDVTVQENICNETCNPPYREGMRHIFLLGKF